MAAEPLAIGIGVPFNDAISAAKARGVVLPDVFYGELQGMARQLAFSIAGVASLDQLQAVKDSLGKALADGGTFAEWKRQAATMSLGLPEHRLDNIFRTNLQSNYAHGHWQRFEATKDRRPYLMYDAINDSRVRPSHLALDGIIRPVDDPSWQSHAPVNGYRCRCGLVALSESQAKARSGPGKGLDKAINLDTMKPDKGWDYNPGKAPLQGIEQAVNDRLASAPPALADALAAKLAQGPSIPVREALSLPKSGKARQAADRVLAAIEKVHGDGELPNIPLKSSQSQAFQGEYRYYTRSGEPVSITLSTAASRNPEATIAHEIGHFLDHQGFGEKGKYSSVDDPLFAAWREAVGKSFATQRLQEILDSPLSDRSDKGRAKYYLDPWEQWARSYAQWLSVRSGDGVLRQQVQAILTRKGSQPYSNSQWSDMDFHDIGLAIDDIFKAVGWLK